MIKTSIFFLVFLFLHISSFSQTQAEMNLEAHENYKKADAELNKVYKELMKLLDKNDVELLKKAQNNWIRYRDSHCTFESQPYEGGSIQSLIQNACLEAVTKTRIDELKVSISDRDM